MEGTSTLFMKGINGYLLSFPDHYRYLEDYSQHKHHFDVLALPSLSIDKNGILLMSAITLTVRSTYPLRVGKFTALFPPFSSTK